MTRTSRSSWAGDRLFWDTMGGAEVRGGNTASHMGIARGGNRMINA
ncbi:MAG: hypothetical protein K0S14_682 [Thermomicrobiales bacterium]|jgi:cell wall-associated NlpC family hydrolase|nr:hypothetical protein [Thermomicrobiales bacterium]MCD6056693.1 hypothetical protein [Thermomicrobiales bacterium]MDF2758898.1 hypothetical protein [Thermomicrobiales bacterium]MDF3014950.1 hypothetical protein [Thermomicrobiales bacterium]